MNYNECKTKWYDSNVLKFYINNYDSEGKKRQRVKISLSFYFELLTW